MLCTSHDQSNRAQRCLEHRDLLANSANQGQVCQARCLEAVCCPNPDLRRSTAKLSNSDLGHVRPGTNRRTLALYRTAARGARSAGVGWSSKSWACCRVTGWSTGHLDRPSTPGFSAALLDRSGACRQQPNLRDEVHARCVGGMDLLQPPGCHTAAQRVHNCFVVGQCAAQPGPFSTLALQHAVSIAGHNTAATYVTTTSQASRLASLPGTADTSLHRMPMHAGAAP